MCASSATRTRREKHTIEYTAEAYARPHFRFGLLRTESELASVCLRRWCPRSQSKPEKSIPHIQKRPSHREYLKRQTEACFNRPVRASSRIAETIFPRTPPAGRDLSFLQARSFFESSMVGGRLGGLFPSNVSQRSQSHAQTRNGPTAPILQEYLHNRQQKCARGFYLTGSHDRPLF